jgi:hypothetical protein
MWSHWVAIFKTWKHLSKHWTREVDDLKTFKQLHFGKYKPVAAGG